MKCPNCGRDILDTAIICPFCNTQFAFSAPSIATTKSPNLYETVEEKVEMPSPNALSMPSEPKYPNEEEINPDAMTYYVDKNNNGINDNEEVMHIYGRPIEINNEVPVNPMEMVTSTPIRPEPPRNTTQVVTNTVVRQAVPSVPPINASTATQTTQSTTQYIDTGPTPVQPVNNDQPFEPSVPLVTSSVASQPVQATPVTPVQPVVQTVQPVQATAEQILNAQPAKKQETTLRTSVVSTANLVPENGIIDIKRKEEQEVKEKKNAKKKDELFFVSVIIIGTIVMIILIISMFVGKEEKDKLESETTTSKVTSSEKRSENVGLTSSLNYPLYVGDTALASYYDEENKVITKVDVTGIRFIKGVEASELANAYAKEALNEGFEWIGFEYQVAFNDLNYLKDSKVSPILEAKFYKWSGCDFINYNGKNYIINITSIYDGENIGNKETATIKIVYQLPTDTKEYSICFGNIDNALGCFTDK